MPRWGSIGKQKIEDCGPLPPHPMDGIKYNMETVDDSIRDFAITFMDKAKADGKPFFVWLQCQSPVCTSSRTLLVEIHGDDEFGERMVGREKPA